MAATRQRAVAAPLNPDYPQGECEFWLDDLTSAVLLLPKGTFHTRGLAALASLDMRSRYSRVLLGCY